MLCLVTWFADKCENLESNQDNKIEPSLFIKIAMYMHVLTKGRVKSCIVWHGPQLLYSVANIPQCHDEFYCKHLIGC